ncbi:helix-turn-helix domain-containing protein [Candidatus Daviesbacteria bacterium]|nr:helix-turn-helix domain-containing protein [Candidatus Daviesbacteria bacterium]
MLAKVREHQQAVYLRKKGKSYAEIAYKIQVSQSTLSLWLRDVKLTKEQIDSLFLKKLMGQRKGGFAKRRFREQQEERIIKTSSSEVDCLSTRELWLLGIIAYWCEGSKQKENNVSQRVVFTNSDPFLLKLFVKWIREICLIGDKDIVYNLHIHENADVSTALNYWSKLLNIKVVSFGKTSIKTHKILTKRKNIGENYHGLIRIGIRKSTSLNRKIRGWVKGLNNLI